MPAGSTAKVLETEQWRSLLREVRLYLSDVDRLFVHDGAVGAFPGTATKVQVIGDDAISALFFAHTLQTTPLGDAFHFTPDLTVYFVAKYAFAPHFPVPASLYSLPASPSLTFSVGGSKTWRGRDSRVRTTLWQRTSRPVNMHVTFLRIFIY
jgi:hypothetical protein